MKISSPPYLPIVVFLILLLASCAPSTQIQPPEKKTKQKYSKATQRPYVINNKKYYPIPSAEGYREPGMASWYGKKFHGRKTANGEIYDMYGKTAAHKTLPMNTMLLVKNLENGKTTVVRVNDRGPFVKTRILDLTYAGASELGMLNNGTARVIITALGEAEQTKELPASQPVQLKHQDFDKGRFYIQVGAFAEISNARKLAKTFAGKGRDVIIQQFPAAGISLYRVMVFSGTSLAGARRYEKQLEASGFTYALVIAR
ncbi:MAG: septal ring lytic transglycosylase RlpA family protein [Desulfobulbaceae bacterium]|nr:septal ring lytic transglycosylase RlpA family protein [Desulfobulbaceae bacterium]